MTDKGGSRGTGTLSLEERVAANVLMNPPPTPVQGDVSPQSNSSGSVENRPPPPGMERVFRQIEASADYYGPTKYLGLLSYYNDLSGQPDFGLAQDYIGLTAAEPNPKMFVVGILPPVSNVTGALLDRSGSAAALEPVLPVRAYDQGGPKLVLIDGKLVPDPAADEDADGKDGVQAWGAAAKTLPDYFWVEFVTMAEDLGVDPVELAAVCYNESGFNPAAYNPDGHAKGLFQFIPSSAVPYMTPEEWDTFEKLSASEQLPYFKKFLMGGKRRGVFGPKTGTGNNAQRVRIYSHVFGGYPEENLNREWYVSTEAQEKYLLEIQKIIIQLTNKIIRLREQDPPDELEIQRLTILYQAYQKQLTKGYPKGNKAATNQKAYEVNIGFDSNNDGAITTDDIARAVAGKPPSWIQKKLRDIERSGQRSDGAGSEGNKLFPMWKDDGSPAAALMRKLLSQIAQTGYNATPNGQRFLARQAAQAIETQIKLDNMRNTPPLRLLVNPSGFSVKGEKIVSDGNWGRNGPIIEHWGDGQDKISGTGKVAGFYTMLRENARVPGLNRTAKFFTKSFQNFLSLFLIYKNNGGLYLNEGEGNEARKNLSVVGSVYIYYDNTLYLGSFDNFNITEEATSPHTLEYSFEFTVRAAFLLDRPNEQGFTYGSPNLFVAEKAEGIPVTSRDEVETETALEEPAPPVTKGPGAPTDADLEREQAAYEAGLGPPSSIADVVGPEETAAAEAATEAARQRVRQGIVAASPQVEASAPTASVEVRQAEVLRQWERFKSKAITLEQWDAVLANNPDIKAP